MDRILEILFESVAKVRLLRLFMQNMDRHFTLQEIKEHTQIVNSSLARDLNKLVKIGLVKEKSAAMHEEKKAVAPSRKKRKKQKNKKILTYAVNSEFPVLNELSNFVIKSSSASRKKILSDIKRVGKIKLAIISGIFLNDDTSRLDLMVVGEDIKKRSFERFLANTESELGKTLRYSIMDIDEFRYRLNMYDRFLRDVLEHDHEKLINKLDI